MKPRNHGFALILVIWSLVLLSSLAGGFAFAVRHEVRVAADMESIARAEAAATAALHTAVLALIRNDRESRWLPDASAHAIPWPAAQITVHARAESARIDINRSPPEVLAGLFSQLFPDADSLALADAVIDWRDKDDRPEPNGAEQDTYLQAGYEYGPANSPFRSVNELGRVIGFESSMLEKARQYLTIYSRQPRVNAASADLVTLTAVPGIDQDMAGAFIAQRERALANGDALDYTALRTGRRYLDMRPGGKLISLEIEVRLDEGARRREHAVIRLDRTRGYTLLARATRPLNVDRDGTDR